MPGAAEADVVDGSTGRLRPIGRQGQTGPILIIGTQIDPHISYFTPKLDALGVEWIFFDPEDFPRTTQVSMRFGESDDWALHLSDRGRDLDLRAVRSVWYRGRSRPVAHADALPDQQSWIAESCARFLSEMYECMDCLWLPERPMADREPFRIKLAAELTGRAAPTRLQTPSPYNKMHQLGLAARMGLAVPRTLITNDPDAFLAFYESCAGQVIAKRSTNLEVRRDGEHASAPTVVVTRRDLTDYRSIRHEPVVLQEKIEKKLELRVTVVGNRVFPSAVYSQDFFRLQVDRGHHAEYGGERYHAPYPLPPELVQACVDITSALGLCYGAIDIILTPDDRYIFLEVNPNGQWAFIEEFTGMPIGDAIADMLIDGALPRDRTAVQILSPDRH